MCWGKSRKDLHLWSGYAAFLWGTQPIADSGMFRDILIPTTEDNKQKKCSQGRSGRPANSIYSHVISYRQTARVCICHLLRLHACSFASQHVVCLCVCVREHEGMLYPGAGRAWLRLLQHLQPPGSILLIVVEDHQSRVNFSYGQLVGWGGREREWGGGKWTDKVRRRHSALLIIVFNLFNNNCVI